jgi:hypothetical protein
MKKLIFTLLLCTCFASLLAQTEDEKAIKSVIDQLFSGMRKTDSSMVKTTLGETCFLKTVVKTKSGETRLMEEKVPSFLKAVGTTHDGIYDERLLSYDIKIDGEMAIAWTPYEFWVSDQFSHCGVNVFTLMKTGQGWKIIGIVDTRRKQGCKG